MNEILVHSVRPADVPSLLSLVEALAHYEQLPPPTSDAQTRLGRDAVADPPRFFALLAELDGQAVGYAIYFDTYSTFLALPTLYLEDIFVLPEVRGQGVGQALFRTCAAEAARRGCGRMEWQVLRWNDLAIGFYQHLGAQPLHEDWQGYRLEGEALSGFTAGEETAMHGA